MSPLVLQKNNLLVLYFIGKPAVSNCVSHLKLVNDKGKYSIYLRKHQHFKARNFKVKNYML